MRFRTTVSALLSTMLLSNYICVAQAKSTNAVNNEKQLLSVVPSIKAPNQTKSATTNSTQTPVKTKQVTVKAVPIKGTGAKLLDSYLSNGKLQEGEAGLVAELQKHPKDDQTRFGLGMLQFLHAVERLVQDFHRFGIRDMSTRGADVPFLRLPTPVNTAPEAISYQKLRKIFEALSDSLMQADKTLSEVNDENVKLPVRFGMIKLDLNGDGREDEDETLWKVYSGVTRTKELTTEHAQSFSIAFDRGDVHWLRGYCHLLSAMCNVYLAYDSHESFECNAHMFFTRVDSPYPFLNHGKHVHDFHGDVDIVDIISLIHLIRWKVAEPERMQTALHDLEEMVKQSKDTWKYYMAETDDDREWIPNPKQTGVLPDAHVTEEMVVVWTDLMNQIEKLLAGKLLIAFWRGDDGRGVNLRRVFTEPQPLDLVLWVQGTAAAPYLEKGETTKIETWRKLRSAFGHNFPGFAIWFN